MKVDFTCAPDDEPLRPGWLLFQGNGIDFQGNGIDPFTERFNFKGQRIDRTIQGNTHGGDDRAAPGSDAVLSDLLGDGPLCKVFREMVLTFENLNDREYNLRACFHAPQVGLGDGRPFTLGLRSACPTGRAQDN